MRFINRFVKRLFRKRNRFILLVLIILLFTTVLLLVFFSRFRKLVLSIASSSADSSVIYIVNEVIADELSNGEFDYDSLVTLEKDDSGRISALRTNMANVTILQSEISNMIVRSFASDDITDISVPIGSALGLKLLYARGPRIKVKTLSFSNVSTEFKNKFTSAGINQTRHEVILEVHVLLGLNFAGLKTTQDVVTEVRVADTIIVGTVPDTFTDFN